VVDEKHMQKASVDFNIEPDSGHSSNEVAVLKQDYEGKPTEEELATLRRVPGKIPTIAYLLCAVEFCERASYYGW
jgi:hypothetical protein